MENTIIKERLTALRKAMADRQIDFYLMPTADFHNSEYVNDYFKVRQYFCNFSGSNGTLAVWQEGAGLWTDGRYFIQAEKELEGTGVTLFRMLDEGVPTIEEFLKQNLKEGQTLGFDGRVISARDGKKYEKVFAEQKIRFAYVQDLADEIWKDRPAFPCGRAFVISDDIAGRSVADKLLQVREKMKEQKAESFVLTKLDDIMWLFNIRGCDVECNPVAMSYAYIDQTKAVLFIQKDAICGDGEIKGATRLKLSLDYDCETHFRKNGIEVKAYGDVAEFLSALPEKTKVLLDLRHVNYTLYKTLSEKAKAEVLTANNPTELLKSVKNDTELARMEEVYLKDNVALTKFIYWLKTNIAKIEITEVSAADKLEEFRREIPEFIDLSFPTIAGYEANAAMMHYEATAEDHAVLKPEGFLLVDSGGQYMGGTTDVTRTIALGPLRDIEKYHYTLVAVGQLALTNARFLYGCTGRNLDLQARKPLWEIGLDYKCGTGHGVGYLLNVHEGPQNLRWRFVEGMAEVPIEAGMDITNEPGVYIEGSHGIRIENVMVAKNDEKNEYGQFMHFDTLTWVPFEMDAIDPGIMSEESKKQLNAYQRTVYEKLSPYLNEEEREWLKKETRPCC